MTGDARRFREAVARNAQSDLGPEIHSALTGLAPQFEEYIRQSESMVDLAERDREAASSQLPHFRSAFEAQEKVSDLILENERIVALEAESSKARTRTPGRS